MVGYWIEGIPYPASGLAIDSSTTENPKATELGFEAELFWEPRRLDPETVQKNGTLQLQREGGAIEAVRVNVRVYYEDISGVARCVGASQTMVFEDHKVLNRLVPFLQMQGAFMEQRERTKRLPDEVEFYRRWKATEGGGATN